MQLYLSSYADFYSAILLIILFIVILTKKDFYTFSERVFLSMVIISFTILITEGISFLVDGISGTFYHINNYATNYYLYLATPFIAVLWSLYVETKMNGLNQIQSGYRFYKLFFILSELLIVINIFTGCVFYIDDANLFHRNWLYFGQAGLFFALFFNNLWIVLKWRQKVDRHIFISIVVFVILPVLGGVLQVVFLGYASLHTMFALGLLTVYLSIETVTASKDGMTKLFVRSKILDSMDAYIRSKTPFTALLIDMDNLKEINDNHGHHEGDRAIIDLANGLLKICDNNHMIARIGGDEFLILTTLVDIPDIDSRLEDLNAEINKKRTIPVQFSWGYYRMRHESDMTVDDILITVDERMYQQKAINKNYRRRRSDR